MSAFMIFAGSGFVAYNCSPRSISLAGFIFAWFGLMLIAFAVHG